MWSVHWFMLLLATILCHLCAWNFADASDIYSSYRSYRQKLLARYTRAYTFKDLGRFRYYQSRYSYHARLSTYYVQTYSTSWRTCGNFEANTYGDYIGYFDCPLIFEQKNATYCCGTDKANYCCDKKPTSSSDVDPITTGANILWSWYIYIAIVVGCLFGIGCLIGLIYGIIICIGVSGQKTTRRNRVNATTTITTAGAYPMQTGGAYPMQTQVGYAQPPPAYPGPPAYSGPPPNTAPPPYPPPQGAPPASYPAPQAAPPASYPPPPQAAPAPPQAAPAPPQAAPPPPQGAPATDAAYPPPAAYNQQ